MVYLIIYIIIIGLLAHFRPYVDLEDNVLWYNTSRQNGSRKYIKFNIKKQNMWQKCPVCLGTGIDNSIIIFNKKIKCTTCDGKKVINTITGNPSNINEKRKKHDDIYSKNISDDRVNFMITIKRTPTCFNRWMNF